RARVDEERVLVLVDQRVALLRHDRLQQDVTGVRVRLARRGDDGVLAFGLVTARLGDATGLGRLGGLRGDRGVTGSHQTSLPSLSLALFGPATKDSKAALVKTTSSETRTSYVFSWPGSRM